MIDSIHADDLKCDLTWTAFRYVSGEMSNDEVEAFELRLADDQACRDAVVRAVGLSSTVAAALPQSTPSRLIQPTDPARRNWLLAAISATCVVLGLVIFSQTRLVPPDATSSSGANSKHTASVDDSTEAGQLIGLWTLGGGDSDGITSSDDVSSESNLADSSVDALIVPGWMIAAVTHEVDADESDVEYQREMN